MIKLHIIAVLPTLSSNDSINFEQRDFLRAAVSNFFAGSGKHFVPKVLFMGNKVGGTENKL